MEEVSILTNAITLYKTNSTRRNFFSNIASEDQQVDLLTKPLRKTVFEI